MFLVCPRRIEQGAVKNVLISPDQIGAIKKAGPVHQDLLF